MRRCRATSGLLRPSCRTARRCHPSARPQRQQLRAALDAVIDRLRPEYRRVVVLRYQEDLDYAEIADIMNVPVGTVKTFLHRARQALADELRRAGGVRRRAETGRRIAS